ncbi:MAG: LapA family protein [Zetaproteobacteria bacterium]|nr:LapA family protein [Zetaproteobacteria bacterium]
MNWINVVVIIVITSFATYFALSNTIPVHIALAGVVSNDIPLYTPIFIAFLCGFMGGMLSLSFSRQKHKREISHLRGENHRLHQEVENLRNIPLQDDL